MIFNRKYRYSSALPAEDIKSRLVGSHLQVHHLDFEVLEKENMLRIIPHAEEINSVKTLPITHVEFGRGNKGTQVVISAKPRRIDAGGPYLIVTFCLFAIIGACVLYFVNENESIWPPLSMLIAGVGVFVIFWLRMETGYFDYVRKIRNHIKAKIK